jgi:hypothetical protein
MHIVYEDRLCFARYWYILCGWSFMYLCDWCVISDWTGVGFLVVVVLVRVKHDMHTNELEIVQELVIRALLCMNHEWIYFLVFFDSIKKGVYFLSLSICINDEKGNFKFISFVIRCHCAWKKGWKILHIFQKYERIYISLNV